MNTEEVYNSKPLLKFVDPHLFEMDVSLLSPKGAAEKILRHIKDWDHNPEATFQKE